MSIVLGVASPGREKQRQRWWDSGIVAACHDSVNIVLVGRDEKAANDTDTSQAFRTATVTVTASSDFRGQFSEGMGFAVVESTLYTFGGLELNVSPDRDSNFDQKTGKSYWKYPRDVYVCDLGADPEIQTQPFQSRKREDAMEGPKVSPIHVPYEKDKIFILSSSYIPLLIGATEPQRPAPCEVLNLEDLTVKTLSPPSLMWDTGVTGSNYPYCFPIYIGHVVVGSELIVYVKTWENFV